MDNDSDTPTPDATVDMMAASNDPEPPVEFHLAGQVEPVEWPDDTWDLGEPVG